MGEVAQRRHSPRVSPKSNHSSLPDCAYFDEHNWDLITDRRQRLAFEHWWASVGIYQSRRNTTIWMGCPGADAGGENSWDRVFGIPVVWQIRQKSGWCWWWWSRWSNAIILICISLFPYEFRKLTFVIHLHLEYMGIYFPHSVLRMATCKMVDASNQFRFLLECIA